MRAFLRLAPLAALVAAGCGKHEQATVYPVSGQVVYDGKPIAGVKVFFLPDGGAVLPADMPTSRAVTGPDGRFALTTYADGDGAPEGKYRVALYWEDAGEEVESPPDKLLGWYSTVNTKLTAKVAVGGSTIPPFKLPVKTTRPGVSEGIPGMN